MKTADEIMGLVVDYGTHCAMAISDAEHGDRTASRKHSTDGRIVFAEIRAALTALTALAAGECSVAGLADDLRLVAQLESKRMGAMSSGLLKGVIDRLSALPPPPAEGELR